MKKMIILGIAASLAILMAGCSKTYVTPARVTTTTTAPTVVHHDGSTSTTVVTHPDY